MILLLLEFYFILSKFNGDNMVISFNRTWPLFAVVLNKNFKVLLILSLKLISRKVSSICAYHLG